MISYQGWYITAIGSDRLFLPEFLLKHYMPKYNRQTRSLLGLMHI